MFKYVVGLAVISAALLAAGATGALAAGDDSAPREHHPEYPAPQEMNRHVGAAGTLTSSAAGSIEPGTLWRSRVSVVR